MEKTIVTGISHEELLSRLMALRPIDDMLFRLLSGKKEVCQEITAALLGARSPAITRAIPQCELIGIERSVILDTLCTTAKQSYVNLEVQKDQRNDDLRRTRFHASLITANYTPKGAEFEDVPDVKVIYISEYDALNSGMPVTKVTKEIKYPDGSAEEITNGEEIYFATSAVKDDSKASRLLQRMVDDTVFDDPEFPHLSAAVNYFKTTRKGNNIMCKLAEDLRKEGELRGEIKGRAEGMLEGKAEGMLEGELKLLVSLIKEGIFTLEEAAKKYGFTEQQLKQAMK